MKAKKVNKEFKSFFKRIKKVLKRPDMALLPGELAFFFVLSIIPTLTLISYGASILNLSTDVITNFLEKAFSPTIASLILGGSTLPQAGLKLTIVLIVCYYISSNGMNSIIVTSNAIYGIENGNWFIRRIKAISMSVIFTILLLFILLFPVFGNLLITMVQNAHLASGVTSTLIKVVTSLQSPFIWIILFFLIKIMYIIAPDRSVKAQNTNYGAIFTTIAWIVTTVCYSYYINNIADYTAFYGNLTNICVLMIWFYLIAFFFVIGMSLNYQRETDRNEAKETK